MSDNQDKKYYGSNNNNTGFEGLKNLFLVAGPL